MIRTAEDCVLVGFNFDFHDSAPRSKRWMLR
jgi:hypothetical protein